MSDFPPRAPAPGTDEASVELLEELPSLRRKGRKQRLVLVGAGQTHLRLLDWWRERPLRGVDLTLVSAEAHAVTYSRLPQALAGTAPESRMEIDLLRLANRCGATLIIDKVIGLDPELRTLSLALHDEVPFDVASLNIGSANDREDLCRQHRLFVPVKPLGSFLSRWFHRWQELESQWQLASETERLRLVVVGGGRTGVELSLALNERVWRERWPARVALWEARPQILSGWSPQTARLAARLCEQRRIELRTHCRVVDCDDLGPSQLILENGERMPADLAIWAAGSAPPAVLKNLPLPQTARGYLALRRTLQTTADLPIFAAGSVAELDGQSLARVPAESQARILWENLRERFRGGRLKEIRPLPAAVRFLTCSDGSAIAESLGWAFRTNWFERRRLSQDMEFLNQLQK